MSNKLNNIKEEVQQPKQNSNETKYDETEMYAFDDDLCEYHNGDLLAGIYGFGFERPSPIQSKAILPMLDGRDVIAQAQAGSGKTGAFIIPALAKVDLTKNYPQVIIIGNTRPLATQIHYNAKRIGSRLIENHGLKIALCIGGAGTKDARITTEEIMESQMLIGTPGKIVGLSELEKKSRSKLSGMSGNSKILDKISLLILDEADILLQEEFAIQIQKIIKKIPNTAQICLFSATYPKEIINLTNQFLINPVRILVENEKVSVDGIKNFWVNVEREEYKYDTLVDIYKKVSVCQAVIFVNSIEKAIQLSNDLTGAGHAVGVIHSKLEEIERVKILEEFRKTQIRVLIATDLIARGIDVHQVGLIINYDVPYDADKYIHRVGRSGRFGKLGVAITFMVKSKQDIYRMEEIERKYKINFEELRNSSDIEIVNNYLTGIKSR